MAAYAPVLLACGAPRCTLPLLLPNPRFEPPPLPATTAPPRRHAGRLQLHAKYNCWEVAPAEGDRLDMTHEGRINRAEGGGPGRGWLGVLPGWQCCIVFRCCHPAPRCCR